MPKAALGVLCNYIYPFKEIHNRSTTETLKINLAPSKTLHLIYFHTMEFKSNPLKLLFFAMAFMNVIEPLTFVGTIQESANSSNII